MKKIGFITTNKVFAQSLAALIKDSPDLQLEPYLLLDLRQAALDAEVLKIEVAVVEEVAGVAAEAETIRSLCQKLRRTVPGCQILLLVPPNDAVMYNRAMEVVADKLADDFIFCDASLDYLLTKLLAL